MSLSFNSCSSTTIINIRDLPKEGENILQFFDRTKAYEAFQEITKDYKENEHDCDDMAQEFRDYLLSIGIKPEHLRITVANDERPPSHAWLELRDGLEWKIYDPAWNNFDYFPNAYKQFKKILDIYEDGIFSDGTGYKRNGDRYEDGKWTNRKDAK